MRCAAPEAMTAFQYCWRIYGDLVGVETAGFAFLVRVLLKLGERFADLA
jgi:hypothetical protein